MHYLTRKTVNDRLRLASRQSFRVVPPTGNELGMIPSTYVADILNRAAHGELPSDEIPFDLATADELSEETGIPARRILKAARRTKAPCPHYRINNWTVRFRRSSFARWLSAGRRNMGAA